MGGMVGYDRISDVLISTEQLGAQRETSWRTETLNMHNIFKKKPSACCGHVGVHLVPPPLPRFHSETVTLPGMGGQMTERLHKVLPESSQGTGLRACQVNFSMCPGTQCREGHTALIGTFAPPGSRAQRGEEPGR